MQRLACTCTTFTGVEEGLPWTVIGCANGHKWATRNESKLFGNPLMGYHQNHSLCTICTTEPHHVILHLKIHESASHSYLYVKFFPQAGAQERWHCDLYTYRYKSAGTFKAVEECFSSNIMQYSAKVSTYMNYHLFKSFRDKTVSSLYAKSCLQNSFSLFYRPSFLSQIWSHYLIFSNTVQMNKWYPCPWHKSLDVYMDMKYTDHPILVNTCITWAVLSKDECLACHR